MTYQLERSGNVLGRSLLRIGQIKENLSPGPSRIGTKFRKQRCPQIAHVRHHCPIHKGDKFRRGKSLDEFITAKPRLDILPRNLIQLHRLAQQPLSVLKLERVRAPWLGYAVSRGPPRKLIEYGMHHGITQCPHISDLDPQPRQSIGHDWSIAAQLGSLHHQLDVRALTRRIPDPVRQRRDRGKTMIILRVVTFIHHVDNFVDKTIQPDKGAEPAGRFNERQKPRRTLLPEFMRFSQNLTALGVHEEGKKEERKSVTGATPLELPESEEFAPTRHR